MNSSPSIGFLTKALCLAKKHFEPIKKNKSIKYSGHEIWYADLAEIISATESALGDQGICMYQTTTPAIDSVIIETTLSHVSGEWISSTLQMPVAKGGKNGSQDYGAVITYARRYSMAGILCIAPSDDMDAALLESSKPIAKLPFVKPTHLTTVLVTQLNNDGKLSNEDISEFKAKHNVKYLKEVSEDVLQELLTKVKE